MSFPPPIKRQSGRINVQTPMPAEEKKPIAHVPDMHTYIMEGWRDSNIGIPAKKVRVICWDGSRMWQNCTFSRKRNQFENEQKVAIKVFMWKKE